MTDIDNNDLSLLGNVKINSFFKNDSYGSAVLIFRPKNTELALLTKPQVNGIYIDESDQKKIKLHQHIILVIQKIKEEDHYDSTIKALQENFNNLIEAKPGLEVRTPDRSKLII